MQNRRVSEDLFLDASHRWEIGAQEVLRKAKQYDRMSIGVD